MNLELFDLSVNIDLHRHEGNANIAENGSTSFET